MFYGFRDRNHAVELIGLQNVERIEQRKPKIAVQRVCSPDKGPCRGSAPGTDGTTDFVYWSGERDKGIESRTHTYQVGEDTYAWSV